MSFWLWQSSALANPQTGIRYIGYGQGGGGTTSVTPNYPKGIRAGTLLVMVITNKYPNNGPTTPSGWTRLTNAQQSGGHGVSGADSGNVYVTVLYKISDGTETGTQSVTISGGSASLAIIYAFDGDPSQFWELAAVGGANNTPGTSWSVTASSGFVLMPNDLVITASSANTDAYSYSAFGLSATGATFDEGNITIGTNGNFTVPPDASQIVTYYNVLSGTSTAAPVFTMTASGSTVDAPAGATVFFRLRQFASPAQLHSTAYPDIVLGLAPLPTASLSSNSQFDSAIFPPEPVVDPGSTPTWLPNYPTVIQEFIPQSMATSDAQTFFAYVPAMEQWGIAEGEEPRKSYYLDIIWGLPRAVEFQAAAYQAAMSRWGIDGGRVPWRPVYPDFPARNFLPLNIEDLSEFSYVPAKNSWGLDSGKIPWTPSYPDFSHRDFEPLNAGIHQPHAVKPLWTPGTRLFIDTLGNTPGTLNPGPGTYPSGEQSSFIPDVTQTLANDKFNRLGSRGQHLTGTTGAAVTTLGQVTPQKVYFKKLQGSPLLRPISKINRESWHLTIIDSENSANANFCINGVNLYVWRPSSGTKVGTVIDNTNVGKGSPDTTASLTVWTFDGAEVTGVQPEDVLILELWATFSQADTATYTATMFIGSRTLVQYGPENNTTLGSTFIETAQTIQAVDYVQWYPSYPDFPGLAPQPLNVGSVVFPAQTIAAAVDPSLVPTWLPNYPDQPSKEFAPKLNSESLTCFSYVPAVRNWGIDSGRIPWKPVFVDYVLGLPRSAEYPATTFQVAKNRWGLDHGEQAWKSVYPDFIKDLPRVVDFPPYPAYVPAINRWGIDQGQVSWSPTYPDFPGNDKLPNNTTTLSVFSFYPVPILQSPPPNPLTWQPVYPDQPGRDKTPLNNESLTSLAYIPAINRWGVDKGQISWKPTYPEFPGRNVLRLSEFPFYPAYTSAVRNWGIDGGRSPWKPTFPDFPARSLSPINTEDLSEFSFYPKPLAGLPPLTWQPTYPDQPAKAKSPINTGDLSEFSYVPAINRWGIDRGKIPWDIYFPVYIYPRDPLPVHDLTTIAYTPAVRRWGIDRGQIPWDIYYPDQPGRNVLQPIEYPEPSYIPAVRNWGTGGGLIPWSPTYPDFPSRAVEWLFTGSLTMFSYTSAIVPSNVVPPGPFDVIRLSQVTPGTWLSIKIRHKDVRSITGITMVKNDVITAIDDRSKSNVLVQIPFQIYRIVGGLPHLFGIVINNDTQRKIVTLSIKDNIDTEIYYHVSIPYKYILNCQRGVPASSVPTNRRFTTIGGYAFINVLIL